MKSVYKNKMNTNMKIQIGTEFTIQYFSDASSAEYSDLFITDIKDDLANSVITLCWPIDKLRLFSQLNCKNNTNG